MNLPTAVLILSCLAPAVLAACSGGRSKRELRGAWIATVANIDWPKSSTRSTSQNQADLRALLDTLQDTGINAIVFQVRPAGDAFYKSSIEPWSKYLTGQQGRAPSPVWDPLEFIVEECHKRNMELHAWFNPYRAKTGSTSTSGLASNNMAKAIPQYAYSYGNYVWMDPNSDQVQDRVNAVIMDVVKRYDIDGVHLDDYFYPYPTSQDFPDSKSYQDYRNRGGTQSKSDWRRNNVDRLITRLKTNIKAAKPYVKFGISPFGIWKSGYPSGVRGSSSVDVLYADSRMWLQKGWVDYLAPQLYWKIDPPAQSFTALTDWWSDSAQNPLKRHIYTGLGDYRITESGWSAYEIIHQVMLSQIRKSRMVLGNIHFSSKEIQQNSKGLKSDLKSQVYQTPALVPKMEWLTGVTAPKSPKAAGLDSALTWAGSDTSSVRSWAIYKETGGSCQLIRILSRDRTSTAVPSGSYVVSAVDRLGNEADSAAVDVGVVIGK